MKFCLVQIRGAQLRGGRNPPSQPEPEIPAWIGLKYISFGGHHSQTTECIKALYDLYKCMLIMF